jgi:hypothetical protein
MVVNRLQKALINSHIAPKSFKAKLSKYFFQIRTHTFFNNSGTDFYCEKNNVHKYTLTYQKYKKKVKKRHNRLCLIPPQ